MLAVSVVVPAPPTSTFGLPSIITPGPHAKCCVSSSLRTRGLPFTSTVELPITGTHFWKKHGPESPIP